jgi:hypothetical protein
MVLPQKKPMKIMSFGEKWWVVGDCSGYPSATAPALPYLLRPFSRALAPAGPACCRPKSFLTILSNARPID